MAGSRSTAIFLAHTCRTCREFVPRAQRASARPKAEPPASAASAPYNVAVSENDLPYRATAAGATYDAVPRLPVSVLLHNVRSAYNVGAFFRTLDAVGGAHLYLAGISPTPAHRGVAKTALGAETTLPWSHVEDSVQMLDSLHRGGWTIAAVETLVPAVDLFEWQPSFP